MTTMELASKEYADNQGLPPEVHQRWAKMLEARAVRFYIENHLDQGVADEDLYQGDGNEDSTGEFDPNQPLPNIGDSEVTEQAFHDSLERTVNSGE